jgi:glyoxylase-like metal-dependent hydrolase (beta-lactamase superfamily II)
MRHEFLRHSITVEDVVRLVRLNFTGRVRLYNGPATIVPGISVHPVGGHSVGLQYVKVNTKRGTLILASDTTHFYENLESRRPFPAVINVPVMFDAFDELEAVAPSSDHIVPGHDPEVMKRYPAPSKALEGIAVRLDVAPKGR